MDLVDAKLGEQYYVYLNIDNNLIVMSVPFPLTNDIGLLLATVIGVGMEEVVLGWKPNQTHPANAHQRSGMAINIWQYITDHQDYDYSYVAHRTTIVQSKIDAIPQKYDGHYCTKCGNFYPMAAPNQPDGTLICYSCRTPW